LHYQWYDDETIFGADQDTFDGTPNNLFIKRWTREGVYLETIGGPGNHIALSYDKKWVAGENFYYEDPVKLYLYKHGKTEPSAVIFEHHGITPTWINSGHVNPSFSRDSSRIYYNRPVDDDFSQAYFVDISELAND
jgi:hypothetical protein